VLELLDLARGAIAHDQQARRIRPERDDGARTLGAGQYRFPADASRVFWIRESERS
jgi:hypothetical protein